MDIPSLSFGLGSDGTTLCRVSLSPIRLTSDINHMQVGITVAFEEAGTGEDGLAKALGRVLGGQGITIEGPFVLDGAEFVENATRGLTVGEYLRRHMSVY